VVHRFEDPQWSAEAEARSLAERVRSSAQLEDQDPGADWVDREAAGLVPRLKRPKAIRPACPHPDGGWRWGMGEVTRIPYELGRWNEGRRDAAACFWLVEGEKCVEAGYSRPTRHRWTTAAGGVPGLRTMLAEHEGWRWFEGIDTLRVILDRDDHGHGDEVREIVDQWVRPRVGTVTYWRAHPSIEVPGADLWDHFEAGWTLQDLENL
jgi:hypothetical protein